MGSTFADHARAFLDKLKEPVLPTHLVNWLLAVILLGCIKNSYADEQDGKGAVCGFNRDASACSSTYGFAVFAFLLASALIVAEARWERLANYHRYVYLFMLVASAVLVLCFFGFFVKLAAAWTNTDSTLKDFVGHGNPGAAIAACLLSIPTWGALAYLSYKGYKEDDLGGIERLGTYGDYVDPVTSAYHGVGAGLTAGGAGGGAGVVSAAYDDADPPVP